MGTSPHTSGLTSSDKILLKSRKLIDKSQRAPLRYLDELALHLARENDLETVARTLQAFDSSSISADRLRDYGHPAPEQKAAVTQAMADFGVIVQSLHKARKLSNVQAFSDLAMPIIFQNWADLLRWLTYMLLQVSLDARSNVATLCCELLRGATTGADDDPYRQELAMRDCTIDLIFLLLCQKDDAGSYLYVPPRADRACAILSLFREYFEVPSMRDAIDERLHSRSQRIRSAIFKSLVGRARKCVEMATTRATVVGSIKSLSGILEGIDQFMTDPALWTILHGQDFLREFTAALLVLVERGTSWNMSQDQFVWRAVVNSFYAVCHSSMFSPRSPRYSVLKLMNAGLLPCAHICIYRILDSRSVYAKRFRSILTNMLPYLYTPGVHDAIYDAYSPYDLNLQGSQGPYKWQGYDDFIRWGKTLRYVELRRNDPIALCSNLRHFTRNVPTNPEEEDVAVTMKACQGCHSVVYCSAECQEMDWPIHSKECPSLSAVYHAEKEHGTWVSSHSKAEYLILLETLTCISIPSPTQLLARELRGAPTTPSPHPSPLNHREGLSVTMIDCYAFSDRLFPIDRLSMDALVTSEWRGRSIVPWIPRLQQFVDSVEAEMDSLVIVEGYFRLNETGKALMVTALMRFCTELGDGEKYKVVNSFFTVVTRGYHK